MMMDEEGYHDDDNNDGGLGCRYLWQKHRVKLRNHVSDQRSLAVVVVVVVVFVVVENDLWW
jgi:hypothetical protein